MRRDTRARVAARAERRAARREANRALAKMSLKEEDCVPDAEGAPGVARTLSLRQRAAALALLWLYFGSRACNAAEAALTHAAVACAAAGLSLMEQDILKDWKAKFEAKYTKVGTVKR